MTLTAKEAVQLLRSRGTVAVRHRRYRINLLYGGGATDWLDEAAFLALAETLRERAPIPADLTAAGWAWSDRGYLTSADGLLIIARPDPIAVARACEAARERAHSRRKPKQERMKL